MAAVEKDEEVLDEKTIESLDDVKKGKPRKFAMICKGAKIVSLVVYKKGSLEKYKKQAKEQGKGQFYHGVIDGKGVNLTFKLARIDGFEKEPGPTTQLKQFLAEKADLKVMPSYEIVDQIAHVLDADDPLAARFLKLQAAAAEAGKKYPDKAKEIEGLSQEIGTLLDQEDAAAEGKMASLEGLLGKLGQGGQQPAAAAAAPPTPPPAPPVPDRLPEFTERLKKLKPEFDLAKAATLPAAAQTKVAEAAVLAKQAGGLVQKKTFAQAFELLDQAEQLLKEALQGGSELEAKCTALKNAVYPQVKPAVVAAPALKDELVNLLNLASKQEKAGAFAEAIASYQQLESKVKQALAGGAKPAGDAPAGGLSIAKLGKARIEWQNTRQNAIASLGKLKAAFQAAYAPEPQLASEVSAALKRLDGIFAKLNDDLHEQLDLVLNEADPKKRADLAKVAKKTMADFASFVDSDPVMQSLDGNEFAPDTQITGPMRAKLSEIAAALG